MYVATNTFMALIAGCFFSFIWANFIYPEVFLPSSPRYHAAQSSPSGPVGHASSRRSAGCGSCGVYPRLHVHPSPPHDDRRSRSPPVSPMLLHVTPATGGTLIATLSFRFIQPLIEDQDTQAKTLPAAS